ncbi:hypothetical protein BDQ17DRAFT_1023001 [Cyathus striatus]|nr:hypothetical protein BDQ17DRAFT_1023001 [Cyathus striatus]
MVAVHLQLGRRVEELKKAVNAGTSYLSFPLPSLFVLCLPPPPLSVHPFRPLFVPYVYYQTPMHRWNSRHMAGVLQADGRTHFFLGLMC